MAIELIAGSLVSGPAGISGGFPSPVFDSTDATIIIAGASSYAGVTPNPDVVDSYSNTWTPIGSLYGLNLRARIFYTIPTTTGAAHTVTLDGFAIYGTISVVAFKNTHATPYGSDESGNYNFGTSATGALTPTAANRVVVTMVCHDGPTTSAVDVTSGGFTTVSTAYVNSVNMGGGLGYQIQTTATAVTPIWEWGGESKEWATQTAAFKSVGDAGGGGGKPHHYYQQMRQRQPSRTRGMIYVPR